MNNRFLAVYAGVLTLAFGALVLTSAARPPAKFEEIDVQRINVREPDGTLRYVISSSAKVPSAIIQGRELPKHRDDYAATLFYNEEGTELGGLRYSGKAGEQSTALTLDGYNRNETLLLGTTYSGGVTTNYLRMNDASAAAIPELLAEDERMKKTLSPADFAAWRKKRMEEGIYTGVDRLEMVTSKGISALALKDEQGRGRLLLMVTGDGKASIQFLDEEGKVQKTIGLDE